LVGIGGVRFGLSETAELTGRQLASRMRAGLSRLRGLAGSGRGLLIGTAGAGLHRRAGLSRPAGH
jgi:superfamily I DNA and RNA helicase